MTKTVQEVLRDNGLENAPRPAHMGPFPPGLPRGIIEDCYDCGVWWYVRPDRKEGHVVRWAFALRDPSVTAWMVGGTGCAEFHSRGDAIRAGTNARIVQVLGK